MNSILRSMRIPFLVLTPVSVFLGFSISVSEMLPGWELHLILLFVGAVLAHISVNLLNEYHDFQSGLDAMTSKTPFSGGSGSLIENPGAAGKVLLVAILSLSLTILIGVYFMWGVRLLILPLGVIGIAIIVSYTVWLNRSPFLCLLAPGIGFGPLMVVGTHMILTGAYSINAIWISLVPFFLVSNLLLLNQFPDIAADKRVGRRHFPIAYGVRKSSFLYGAFVVAACGVIVLGIYTEILPGLSVIALLPLALTIVVFWGALRYATSLPKLLPYLGLNVATTVLTPALLGYAILYG